MFLVNVAVTVTVPLASGATCMVAVGVTDVTCGAWASTTKESAALALM